MFTGLSDQFESKNDPRKKRISSGKKKKKKKKNVLTAINSTIVPKQNIIP